MRTSSQVVSLAIDELPEDGWILLGRPITEVSRYMGHADVYVTMSVYAHFLKPKKQDTMSDLERLIENG